MEGFRKMIDGIRRFNECVDHMFKNNFIVECVWCGGNIESRNNITLYGMDIYHLKCMTEVYETEKENRDL